MSKIILAHFVCSVWVYVAKNEAMANGWLVLYDRFRMIGHGDPIFGKRLKVWTQDHKKNKNDIPEIGGEAYRTGSNKEESRR